MVEITDKSMLNRLFNNHTVPSKYPYSMPPVHVCVYIYIYIYNQAMEIWDIYAAKLHVVAATILKLHLSCHAYDSHTL